MSKQKAETPEIERATLTVKVFPGDTEGQAVARAALQPTVTAAKTVRLFSALGTDQVDLNALVEELGNQAQHVERGSMNRPEAMLIAQAHALNSIFNKLAKLSSVNTFDNFDVSERFMRLALKAQVQCRATLETLGALKNPPVVIARQANVTSGPQQINNGVPRARETQIEQDKLLEQVHGEWLDTGATRQAIPGDTPMEAMATIDGAKVGPR